MKFKKTITIMAVIFFSILCMPLIKVSASVEEIKEMSYTEKWRPQYHYTTEDSWINDPNGLVYFENEWHLFYQTNPHKNYNGEMNWGHAVSDDLTHWRELGFPLSPDKTGAMWSGTAVVDKNNTSGFFNGTKNKQGIVIAYSTNRNAIGMAYSLDNGRTFIKYSEEQNVIDNPGVADFRDPKLLWNEETQRWNMIIAGGQVRIYSSPNLKDWEFESLCPIYTECPDLFKLPVNGDKSNEKWVLTCAGRYYYVGTFDGKNFIKETEKLSMCESPESYAGITYSNANGRIIMVNWLNNWENSQPADGKWCSALSLNIELSLKNINGEYRLIQNAVNETTALRKGVLKEITQKTYAKGVNCLDGISSNMFEMDMTIDMSKTSNFTLEVCKSEKETTRIYFNKKTMEMTFDRTKSEAGHGNLKTSSTFKIKELPSNTLKLRIFVDVSCLEIFINDGMQYYASRIQPFTSSQNMLLTSTDKLKINELKVYQYSSIWNLPNDKLLNMHISEDDITVIIDDGEYVLRTAVFPYGITDNTTMWEIDNSEVAKIEVKGSAVIIRGIKEGKAKITATLKSGLKKECNVLVLQSRSNIELHNLKAENASIKEGVNGLEVSCENGEGFVFSDTLTDKFDYESNIYINEKGSGGLVFQAKNKGNLYLVTLDITTNSVKFIKKSNWKTTEIKKVSLNVRPNRVYKMKVSAENGNFIVYVNDEVIIETNDNSLIGGCLGFYVADTTASFNNATYKNYDIKKEDKKGCKGNIANSSIAVGIASLVTVKILKKKKK